MSSIIEISKSDKSLKDEKGRRFVESRSELGAKAPGRGLGHTPIGALHRYPVRCLYFSTGHQITYGCQDRKAGTPDQARIQAGIKRIHHLRDVHGCVGQKLEDVIHALTPMRDER